MLRCRFASAEYALKHRARPSAYPVQPRKKTAHVRPSRPSRTGRSLRPRAPRSRGPPAGVGPWPTGAWARTCSSTCRATASPAPPRRRRASAASPARTDRRPHRDARTATPAASRAPRSRRTPPARTLPAEPGETVPRGGVDDGRRTIRVGKDEDLPSEIAAIAADRDIPADEPPRAHRRGHPGAPHRQDRRPTGGFAGGRPLPARSRPPAPAHDARAHRRPPRPDRHVGVRARPAADRHRVLTAM